MTEKDKKEGNERRYPLTPQAEANLKEVLPHLDEKLGGDIDGYTCTLREDLQSDVTIALAYFTKALRLCQSIVTWTKKYGSISFSLKNRL